MAYRDSKKYRKIWESVYGPIPSGFEIHHIDGDRNNNRIDNLQCVSIQEHYNIHLEQGDLHACHAISLRMNNERVVGWHHSEDVLAKLRKPKKNKQNYKKSEEHRKKIGDANRGRKLPPKPEEVKQKLRKPKSDDFKKRVSNTMMGISKAVEQCPHCKKVGGVNVMKRWHFNNCKQKNKSI